MKWMPVILWTDWVVYLLLGVLLAYGVHTLRTDRPTPWAAVRRRPTAMAALTILVAYLAVGLLDSVHFRERLSATEAGQEAHYTPEVRSLLDLFLRPLRDGAERTYSAPLSAYAYAKETLEAPDGTTARIYPRLQHGGAHLKHPDAERTGDLWKTALEWGGFGLLAFLILSATLISLLPHAGLSWNGRLRAILRGETPTAWRTLLLTGGLLCGVCFIAAGLSFKYHLLGTDKVGQDVLYLSLKGVRTGLLIGTLTTLVALPFAIWLGICAGFFGGWVDDVIQYIYTTLSSIPGVLLIAASVLTLQLYMDQHAGAFASVTERADVRLFALCVILGVTGWIGLCRLLRGEALKLREMDYVRAAEALGVGRIRIITRHILPNVMHLVLISAVLDFSGLVLAEAVLSYVGIGVDPAQISWGNMINGARLEMAREPVVWWSLASAFVLMFGLVLSANILSDAVRDAFDPRLRGR
jgi:peptide/nickel transport system permease protein